MLTRFNKLFIYAGISLILTTLSGCSWLGLKKQTYDTAYFNKVWESSFNRIQSTSTKLNKKGIYDFEVGFEVQGDKEKLTAKLGDLAKYPKLGVKLFGDYDFNNIENILLNVNAKLFVDKRSIGKGDIDFTVNVASGKADFYINNLEQKALDVFKIDKNISDMLMSEYQTTKGEKNSQNLGAVVSNVYNAIQKELINSPLKQNSKEEEQKIIKDFIDKKVIEVIGGAHLEDNTDRVEFKVNMNNLLEFLNSVAKINGASGNFDSEKDKFKQLTIKGFLDIKDNLIINSDIGIELPLKSIDSKGKEIYDILVWKVNFKWLDLERVNVNIQNMIFANSSPENKLMLDFKAIIK